MPLSAYQFAATRLKGLSATDAAGQYFEGRRVNGQSARGLITHIRRLSIDLAQLHHRLVLVALLESAASLRTQHTETADEAKGTLHSLPASAPVGADTKRANKGHIGNDRESKKPRKSATYGACMLGGRCRV